MVGWNLALRFVLEIGALVGLGLASWQFTTGPVRWTAEIAAPVVTATLWGTFNVTMTQAAQERHRSKSPDGFVFPSNWQSSLSARSPSAWSRVWPPASAWVC